MAFVNTPLLPTHRPRRAICRTTPPRMVEANTLVAVSTVLVGVGGGVGLVAWTEQQGKRTDERVNLQVCVECLGETTITCTVCDGTGRDPLDAEMACSYCDGHGKITCFNCGGTGIQPRFLDRLSPDDFMD